MKTLVACRACGYPTLEPYADLGVQPLANALVSSNDRGRPLPEERYPLVLAHCPNCWLSQLTIVVDPDILYRTYHYVSGASAQWVKHCEDLAGLLPCKKQFIVEIASNDGTLLRRLKDRGASVLGVEPAMNLVAKYPPDLPYLPDYFTDKTARWIKTRYGHADAIVAQNVIGHVDNIRGFLKAIQIVLNRQRGMAILEAPYLYAMLSKQEFPQVYHEHLSYWSLTPLLTVARSVGLEVTSVKPVNVHGGSMRYYLRHAGQAVDYTVGRLLEHEADMQEMPQLRESFDVPGSLASFEAALEKYRGKKVWGYGASAKSTVLLNAAKNSDIISAVMDDHPGKQGKYVPGVHIPIIPPQDLSEVDALVILAWNWEDAITARAEVAGFTGTFLVPFSKEVA